MKTTVDIPEKILADAMRFTKAKTKRAAILTALENLNRCHGQAELIKYFGTFDSLMSNEEMELLDKKDWFAWKPPVS
jgi:hypothetical protein